MIFVVVVAARLRRRLAGRSEEDECCMDTSVGVAGESLADVSGDRNNTTGYADAPACAALQPFVEVRDLPGGHASRGRNQQQAPGKVSAADVEPAGEEAS
jgi:hypothetical protein